MQTYKPLSLLRTRTYPGYQFYAEMKYDGHTPQQCLCYIVLTYMAWLRQKIDAETLPPELKLPAPKEFAHVSFEQLRSYHFSGGFALDITSMPQCGIWAAKIKEPDLERPGKKAVVGRFFVTEIGLRCTEDGVACGVRIDVLDPVDLKEEVAYAYRPAFMRSLFKTKKLRIRQVEPLRYDTAHRVADSRALNRLIDLISDARSLMPVIVVTYAAQSHSIADIVRRLDERLGLTQQADSFENRLKLLDLVPETLEIGNAILPYDPDYMALHSFGLARVYVIEEKQFGAFLKKMNRKDIRPGDMLWIEPVNFGGSIRVIPYDPDAVLDVKEQIRDEILRQAHGYSKHKSISYGPVIFEASARVMEAEERIKARLEEARHADEQKVKQAESDIFRDAQELIDLYEEEKNRVCDECDRLKRENNGLFVRIAALEAKCEKLSAGVSGIVIQKADAEEFYEDEQRDLIISILREAARTYCVEGSRAEQLLGAMIEKNELTGAGQKLFARLKTILYRNKNVTESDLAELEALGFEVTIRAKNHYKLVFMGDPRYTFSLASTGSEVRGMKNACSEITKRISVYK